MKTLEKMSAEVKAELLNAMNTKAMQEAIARIKQATDSGTFEVIISTADTDRSGEIVDQAGWDLTNYKANPIVLWAHDYTMLPIGVADEIIVKDGKLVAMGHFAPADANPFAQQVRRLYDAKIVRTTSVGFIVKESEGNTITKAELLEFSFVPVPANPYALSLRQINDLGVNKEILATKGINIVEKAEGDTCTLDDGTEGVMTPDADGNLVCTPKPVEKKAEGDVCTLDDGTEGVIDANGECIPKPEEKGQDEANNPENEAPIETPEPETEPKPEEVPPETPEVTPGEETKEKGAVADEVNLQDMWDQKWDNLEKVCDVIDAFFNVYLDEKTSVDQFAPLLKEMTTILLGIIPADTIEASAISGSVEGEKTIDTKTFTEMQVTLSRAESDAKKSAQIDATIKAIKAGIGVLQTLGLEHSKREVNLDGGSAKERSNPLESDALTSLKKWNEERAVLKEIATIVGEALAKAKAKKR